MLALAVDLHLLRKAMEVSKVDLWSTRHPAVPKISFVHCSSTMDG